jgi:hypothetical protein
MRVLIVLAVAGATILMLGVILVAAGEGLRFAAGGGARFVGAGDGERFVRIGEAGIVAGMVSGLAVLVMAVAGRALPRRGRAGRAARASRGLRALQAPRGDAWPAGDEPGPQDGMRGGYGPPPASMPHHPGDPYPSSFRYPPPPASREQDVLHPTSVISPRELRGASGDAYGPGDAYSRGPGYRPGYAGDPGFAYRRGPEAEPPHQPPWHGEHYRGDYGEHYRGDYGRPRGSPPPAARRWGPVPPPPGYAQDGGDGYWPGGDDVNGEEWEFTPAGPGRRPAPPGPGAPWGGLLRTDPQPVVSDGEWQTAACTGPDGRYGSPEPAAGPGCPPQEEMPGYRAPGPAGGYASRSPSGDTDPEGPWYYTVREETSAPSAPFARETMEDTFPGDGTAGARPCDGPEDPVPQAAYGDRGATSGPGGSPRRAPAYDGPVEPPSPPAAAAPPRAGTARAAAPRSPGEKEEKLEQLKDLYMTVEAIGDENVGKHFDELLRRQRELINGYFKETGIGDSASGSGASSSGAAP